MVSQVTITGSNNDAFHNEPIAKTRRIRCWMLALWSHHKIPCSVVVHVADQEQECCAVSHKKATYMCIFHKDSCAFIYLFIVLNVLLSYRLQDQPSSPSQPVFLWLQWPVSPRSWLLALQLVMLISHLTRFRSNCPSPVSLVHPELNKTEQRSGLYGTNQPI